MDKKKIIHFAIPAMFIATLAAYALWRGCNVELVIGDGPSFWSIYGKGNGYFTKCGNDVKVVLHSLTVERSADRLVEPEQIVESVQLGLASEDSEGWGVKRWGEAIHINKRIAPGETINLGSFRTSIDTSGLGELSSYWFVLKVDANGPFGIYGSSLAESIPGILTTETRPWCPPW